MSYEPWWVDDDDVTNSGTQEYPVSIRFQVGTTANPMGKLLHDFKVLSQSIYGNWPVPKFKGGFSLHAHYSKYASDTFTQIIIIDEIKSSEPLPNKDDPYWKTVCKAHGNKVINGTKKCKKCP